MDVARLVSLYSLILLEWQIFGSKVQENIELFSYHCPQNICTRHNSPIACPRPWCNTRYLQFHPSQGCGTRCGFPQKQVDAYVVPVCSIFGISSRCLSTSQVLHTQRRIQLRNQNFLHPSLISDNHGRCTTIHITNLLCKQIQILCHFVDFSCSSPFWSSMRRS